MSTNNHGQSDIVTHTTNIINYELIINDPFPQRDFYFHHSFKAIYELACGEEDLVKDLLMIQKNYADPLVQLHILTSTEVSQRRVSPPGKRRRGSGRTID